MHKILPQFEEDKVAAASATRRGSIINAISASNNPLSPKRSANNENCSNPETAPEICYIKILMNTAANPIETLVYRKLNRKKKEAEQSGQYSASDNNYDDDDGLGSIIDNDINSTNSLFMDISNAAGSTDDSFQDGDWLAKYKVPLKRFEIIDRKKRTVIVSFLFRGVQLRREFIFDSEQDGINFCQVIDREKQLMGCRAKARLDAALGDIRLKEGERLSLLFDVVSGTNLPTKSPDPFVVVRFQGKRIHKTDHINNEKNPIWTLRTGSLFLLDVDAQELFEANDGIIMEVKDYDRHTTHSLGAISISPRTIYNWDGERKEFDLKALSGEKKYGEGKLALRVRRATAHDLEFMKNYQKNKKFDIHDVADDILPKLENSIGGSKLKKLVSTHKKVEGGQKMYLVRPAPDPKRSQETEWLTKEQIEEEVLKPSHNWLNIGSGNLGKVFVEVIKCDGLPNKDSGAFGDMTDAFVSLVYEDCFARTHTVDDCLSPRFPPWSRRAFVFNMMHTSSQLFVGVFDSDIHTAHDLIGRVSVDLTNLIPNMVYTLKYNLHPSAKCNPRDKDCGSITIRVRMELEDERTLLMSNFEYHEPVYVNSDNKKDYRVMHQTVHGNVDMKEYGLPTINQYIEEIYDYMTVYYYLEDSFLNLVLWRSITNISVPVLRLKPFSFEWVDVPMPLHSLMLFLCMIALVENPELIPSFFFGSIGWILLGVMERRTSHPNPWITPKSFQHYLWSLVFGDGLMKPRDIAKNENIEQIEKTDGAWKKRLQDAERRAEEYAKEQEEYWKEMEHYGDIVDDLATMKKRYTFNPVVAYLYPIQQWLAMITMWLRVTKNIVTWEESYVSFWLAFASVLLCFVSFFIPWSLIIKWTMRIVTYTCLGPWMKLVDIYYYRPLESPEREEQLRTERQDYLADQLFQAQVARESNTKLKDFKQYMFGKYITKVNIAKRDRFVDKPLPESSAVVYNPGVKSLGEQALQEAGNHQTRVDGQQLVGEMIPKLFETPTTDVPIGKPTKKADADIPNYNDSYFAALAKVSTIVVGASIVSVYLVPSLLSSFGKLAVEDL